MSYDILVQDLRRKSEERIKKIWDDVKAEAEDFYAEKMSGLAQEEKASRSQAEDRIKGAIAPVLHEAEIKAVRIKDDAVRMLAGRLYMFAGQLLGEIRKGDYETLFRNCVEELPEVHWQKVRVNPLDKELAQKYFRDAEILLDKNVEGGFEVIGKNGKCRVNSILEKRLEGAWPYTLPLLLREVLGKDDAKAPS